MCSTLHNYITNRCLQADGHRYCIHPPSIPKETFRYLTVNTFPCLAPPISLSLVVSHWRSNPTPSSPWIPSHWSSSCIPSPRSTSCSHGYQTQGAFIQDGVADYRGWKNCFILTGHNIIFWEAITAKLIKKFTIFLFFETRNSSVTFTRILIFDPVFSQMNPHYWHLGCNAIKDSLVTANISEEPNASICTVQYALALPLWRRRKWISPKLSLI